MSDPKLKLSNERWGVDAGAEATCPARTIMRSAVLGGELNLTKSELPEEAHWVTLILASISASAS